MLTEEKEIRKFSRRPLPPPWIELPDDLTANIIQRLEVAEILESAQKVCTTWRKICKDPFIWRVITMSMRRCDYKMEKKLLTMCRHAVDYSQGQLIELTLHNLGDNQLLTYIADRSTQLRRLTLYRFGEITSRGIAGAAKKLPHLEELHLIVTPSVSPKDVENIGISCPMLKSFTFNRGGFMHSFASQLQVQERATFMSSCASKLRASKLDDGDGSNTYAQVIAKSMSNLRHLRLVANWITNEGLEAILDGCIHLESLDLRRCFALDLQGHLGKRCCEQIKDLKLPHGSFNDSELAVFESTKIIWDCRLDHILSYGDFRISDDIMQAIRSLDHR